MARYYDIDKIKEMIEAKASTLIEGKQAFLYVAKWLDFLPTDDVVPRAEYNELLYKLEGVMHSVDKWLDGDELEQDEVNRAATMREKTLQIVEGYQAQIRATIDFYEKREREIFEEIGKILAYNYLGYAQCYQKAVGNEIAELKKKYTEGGDEG